ncbi:ABC transporter ATP-binding protein [Paenibacillus gansuensis]|uniref:ABC transporter ATP-binding protein n=1 Tax=Paenibacillus gansuensis TaxID=306542 RepID=A0ABW5PHW1_9BACL
MSETVISLERVSKPLGAIELGPIDVKLERGMVYAVVGPNGSGKSSLFKLILGLLKPKQGELRVFGSDPAVQDPALRERIGYVSESSDVYDDRLTGRSWARFIQRWYPQWNGRLFAELVTEMEIDLTRQLRKMSKGERRRFDLAIGLAKEPELLLLDEPSSGLDPLAWRHMNDRLTRFMSGGDRTIVMATHIVEEVRKLADYIIFIHKGKMLGIYEKDELLAGWKVLWVEGLLEGKLGSAVEQTVEGKLTRVVTPSPAVTERELAEAGGRLLRTEALGLDDILYYMIQKG